MRVLYGSTVIGLCRCISPLERLRIYLRFLVEGRHLEGLQRAFAVSTTRFNILTAPVQVLLRRQSFSTEMRTILRQERRALVRALGGGERGEGASRLWDCVREGVLDSLFPAYIQNHVRKPGKPGHRKHRG